VAPVARGRFREQQRKIAPLHLEASRAYGNHAFSYRKDTTKGWAMSGITRKPDTMLETHDRLRSEGFGLVSLVSTRQVRLIIAEADRKLEKFLHIGRALRARPFPGAAKRGIRACSRKRSWASSSPGISAQLLYCCAWHGSDRSRRLSARHSTGRGTSGRLCVSRRPNCDQYAQAGRARRGIVSPPTTSHVTKNTAVNHASANNAMMI
jgi:hypothetical protein